MDVNWIRKLHVGGQADVFHDRHRFKVLACGRRWGKTRLCANIAIDKGIKKKIEIWWVAPTYDVAERGWTSLYEAGGQPLIVAENKVKKMVSLLSGTNLQFKTADNPVSLLGKGIDLLILDECGRLTNDIWYRYLRPTLIDHKGEAIFISSPRGKNWFYDLFHKGQDSLEKDWQSWHFQTLMNPTLDAAEVQAAIDHTPELVRRQEYFAEFLDEANQVFRKIQQCVAGELQEPQPGQSYSGGVDLAKYQDFTVIVIMNQDGHVVYYDRFHQLDWNIQKARVKLAAEKYGAEMLLDSTGLGDPIYDDLAAMSVNVVPYKFTTQTKRQLIENLSIQLEQRNITYPWIEQLVNELQAFECKLSPSGTIHYEGKPDDSVIALALATWQHSRIITDVPKAYGQREAVQVTKDF